jgi:hypothetical protein
MIVNDLKQADYIMVAGNALDVERALSVQLDGGREVIVCRLKSGATAVQFRKGKLQTSALHLEADVFQALCLLGFALQPRSNPVMGSIVQDLDPNPPEQTLLIAGA